ncbi:MAG: Uma2 family endonuclease [Acidimicrobiales bacterium]
MMPVLFRERIPEMEAWLADRRERRADWRDEVWEGTYVVAPAPHQRHGRIAARLIARLVPAADAVGLEVADLANVGGPDDYRILDAVVYRAEAGDRSEPYLASVELIVEIRSPGEDPVAKLPFYRRHDAGEAVLVDPETATVQWLAIQRDE